MGISRSTNEKARAATGAFSKTQTELVQAHSSEASGEAQGDTPLSKYQLLWLAPMPAPRKLVAMALAYHSDDDGRNITCSYLTVGIMSGVQHRQVARHIEDLVSTGVLRLERKAVQHHPAHYTLDLAVLSDLSLKAALDPLTVAEKGKSVTVDKLRGRLIRQSDPSLMTTLSNSRVVINVHPEQPKTPQGGHLRHPGVSYMSTYPLHPSGEREAGAGGPPSAAPEYPTNWPAQEWGVLRAKRGNCSHLAGWERKARQHLDGGGCRDELATQFAYLADNPKAVQLRLGEGVRPPKQEKKNWGWAK